MKKLSIFFLFVVVGLSLLGLSYAQDWTALDYNVDVIPSTRCHCGLPPISTVAVYCLIGILILSILIIPSRGIFKKAGKKPWKSLIPIGNLYGLFSITASKFGQLFSLSVVVLLFGIFIYGKFIYPLSSYSHCCDGDRIIRMNLGIFALFLCIFIIQFYCLARKFGLKVFYSTCLALFFPIGIRILSFGNYEYIGNEENIKNVGSK